MQASIPTSSVEEIEEHRLKALECKRKQVKDIVKRKAKKDARPKKKARVTKGTSPKPSNTIAQEGPSKSSSECLVKLPPSSSHATIEIVVFEEALAKSDAPGLQDRSVMITILATITFEEGVGLIINGIKALV